MAIANKKLTGSSVVIDSKYFTNDGPQPINKKLIVDRLRIELLRAAQGRITFYGRHAADMTEHEQTLRKNGVVQGDEKRPPSPDYRLTGSIKALSSTAGQASGLRTRYHQITFEMIDVDTQEIVWGGLYEYKKAATEDVIYR